MTGCDAFGVPTLSPGAKPGYAASGRNYQAYVHQLDRCGKIEELLAVGRYGEGRQDIGGIFPDHGDQLVPVGAKDPFNLDTVAAHHGVQQIRMKPAAWPFSS